MCGSVCIEVPQDHQPHSYVIQHLRNHNKPTKLNKKRVTGTIRLYRSNSFVVQDIPLNFMLTP